MPRYLNELNECTDPTTGDFLHIYDASAAPNDKDRKVNIDKFAVPSGGVLTQPHFRSLSVTISQNSVAVITPSQALGMILISTNFFPDTSGLAVYRAAGSSFCAIMGGGANFETTTGVLSGTTGNNGKITVSAHTDGKIYIEQRRGAEVTLRITFLC